MDDAGGAENGQSADDAEPRIPGLFGERFALRNGKRDRHIGRQAMGAADLFNDRLHHRARHRIDRRFADRHRQSSARYGSDATAGGECHTGTGRAAGHGGNHGRAMGDIRVVAGILDDACGRISFGEAFQGKREGRLLALGQRDRHRVGEVSGDQRGQRCLGRRRRASARGPAAPERTVENAPLRLGIGRGLRHAAFIGEGPDRRKRLPEADHG